MLRELDFIWASAGLVSPLWRDIMWDLMLFLGNKTRASHLWKQAAPGFLLFLWKQTPTLFTRQRKCFLMHALSGWGTVQSRWASKNPRSQDQQSQLGQKQGLTRAHLSTLLVKHQLLLQGGWIAAITPTSVSEVPKLSSVSHSKLPHLNTEKYCFTSS